MTRTVLLVAAVVAALAGIFFRFWQLGGAPLAVDEYYFGTATLNTLAHGVPAFMCGGYYTRGILLQYLTVPLLTFGSDLELAVRFWPAVASLLSIVAVWRIARLSGGLIAAALAVIFMSLSLWEVEFARFGRMYAPFQAVFLWYAYFQIEHLVRGREYARWCYLALSAVAVFVYAGAAMLLVLNFLAWIWREKRWTVSHLVVAALLLVLGTEYYMTDFRRLGFSLSEYPPQVQQAVAESDGASGFSVNLPIEVPPMPGLVALIGLLAVAALGVLAWRQRWSIRAMQPAMLVWVVAALCYCFGLIAFGVALSLAAVIMRLPAPWRGSVRPAVAAASILALALGWLAVLLPSFWTEQGGFPEAFKDSARYLFDYPDVYYKIALPWIQTIPATTIALGVLMLPSLGAVLTRKDESLDPTRYLLGTLILLGLLVAMLNQPFAITRYSYFLYPIVLVLAGMGISIVTRPLGEGWPRTAVIAAVIGVLFLTAEDFRLSHLARINEPEIRYRTEYGPRLSEHYYLRWDFRGAAEHVNERLEPEDTVLVFEDPPHYLTRTDGIFVREGTQKHYNVWACRGERELWSHAPLLDRESEVWDLIERTRGTVWLIARTPAYPYRDPFEGEIVEELGLTPEFVSEDGNLGVYRFVPSAEAE